MLRAVVFAVSFALTASDASASSDPSHICDAVADTVSREAGLPSKMLRALTRTETGRARSGRLAPWPWTVNMEGAGHWFETREDALAFARKHHARGATSFDVGCFQINYRWHRKAFASVEAMFDPLENARYAARFLTELKAESGDWRTAIGHYHSRTPSRAQKYVARYQRIKDRLKPQADEREITVAARTPGGPAPRSLPALTPAPAPAPVSAQSSAAPMSPGGVALSSFSSGARLLTVGRPLFD